MADWRATASVGEVLATCARKVRCGADAFAVRDEYSRAFRGCVCAECALELRARGGQLLEPLSPEQVLPPRP